MDPELLDKIALAAAPDQADLDALRQGRLLTNSEVSTRLLASSLRQEGLLRDILAAFQVRAAPAPAPTPKAGK